MLIYLLILCILWLTAIIKSILFWVYLWQLKEYHIGRFVDHFRTAKGRDLLFNKRAIIKFLMILSFYFNPLVVFALSPLIYLAESGKVVYSLSRKRILKPAFTPKVVFIILLSVLTELAIVFFSFGFIENKVWLSIFFFPLFLLVSDLIIPLLVSAIAILLKPITYFSAKRLLAKAAEKRNQFKDLIVIGITGSYGKTSTKEILHLILSEKFKVLKTQKHINAEVGIAKTILDNLRPEHQILIAEIGAYNVGKIKEVCQAIKPKIGILTGINEQHMATFGSQENISKAKHEIFECPPPDGIKIEKGNLEIKAENIIENKENVFFKINGIDFNINMLGKHNIDNVLLAAECARKLGMNLEDIAKACSKIKDNRIIKRDPVVIDNSYSANPTGTIADIEYLKLYNGKKAVVMPCLIELGKASKDVHKKIGRKLNEVASTAIITTRDCFEEIKKEFPAAIFSEDPEKIGDYLKGSDVILVEGRVSKNILNKICQ